MLRKSLWAPFVLVLGAGSLIAGEAPAGTGTGAAWPKGNYAALNNLPDWGGVWVLARGRPAAGAAAPEQPKFKGEYLARYQAWQNEVRTNSGVVRRETSNCMPPGMPNMMGTGKLPLRIGMLFQHRGELARGQLRTRRVRCCGGTGGHRRGSGILRLDGSRLDARFASERRVVDALDDERKCKTQTEAEHGQKP